MGWKVSVRLFTVALAAGSLAMIPLASPSSALTSKVSCGAELSAKPASTTGKITATASLSKCINLAPTAKNVSKINTATLSGTSTTTWANGKGTTLQKVTYKLATKAQGIGKCPPATTALRIFVTATTTGGTGAALKAIPKGSIGHSNICDRKDGTAVLEPGTRATF
jgi:hypothetical protein